MKKFFKSLRPNRSGSSEEGNETRPKTSINQRTISRSATLQYPLSSYRDGPLTESERATLDGAGEMVPPQATKAEKKLDRIDDLREALATKSVDVQTRKMIDHEISKMAVNNSTWEAIVASHTDKLIEEVLKSAMEDFEESFKCYEKAEYVDTRVAILKKWHHDLLLHAQKLHTQFCQLEASKDIETFRAAEMHEEPGALHHIRIEANAPGKYHPCSIGAPHPDLWRAIKTGPQGFVPGNWWLNLACASRDGIIDDPNKVITRSTECLVSAIVLHKGKVSDQSTFDEIEYIKESGSHEFLLSQTLLQHGAPIRVILGYRLEGCNYAPRGGFRYDGLYTFKGYSLKTVDEARNINRVTLRLKRCPGQLPIECISHIPRPSQMDDWKLYNKMRYHGLRYMDNAPYTPVSSPVKAKGPSRLFN